MNYQGMWMVVVTYPEWLNWMARGELRLNTRITKVASPEDHAGFAQLMNRAPDLRIDDEQGFVLACLNPDFCSQLADVPGSPVPEVATLSLKAVAEFQPVTERAGRLLEGDARRAQARLGAPLFELAWQKWTTAKQAVDADRRGRALSLALGVPHFDPAQIPSSVLGYVCGNLRLPNADLLDKYDGGRAYGWAAAFGLLAALSSEEAKKDLTKRLELGPLVLRLKNDYALDQPILEDQSARTTARCLGTELREKFGVDVVIEQLATYWHYEQQLRRGKNIELDALVRDIATIYVHCSPTVAANTAWLIGRRMEEAAVTALLYKANPSDWPTMAGTGLNRNSFDVVLAAKLMQQKLANNGAADFSSLQMTIGSNPTDVSAVAEPPSESPALIGTWTDGVIAVPTNAQEAVTTDGVTAAPALGPINHPGGPECGPTESAAVPDATPQNPPTDLDSNLASDESDQWSKLAAPPDVTSQTYRVEPIDEKMSQQATPEIRFLLSKLVGEMTRQDIQDALELPNPRNLNKYLKPAIEQGVLEMTLPYKPSSSNQRYRLTTLGQRCLAAHSDTNID